MDAYFASFSGLHLERLSELRSALAAAVPNAHEKVNYGMPAIALRKNILYYAAWEKHVALYGWLGADDVVIEPLKSTNSSKGTLKVPLDEPLPLDAIEALARHLAERCR